MKTKTEELANPASCLSRAEDNEPVFVLIGRDTCAADAVELWIELRIASGKNERADNQIQESLALAETMRAYYRNRLLKKIAP